MPQGTPPSQYLRRVGGTEAQGVTLQRGANDWDAFEAKANKVAVCDELDIRFQYNYTEANANTLKLTYQILSREMTSLTFKTRSGREILTGLDGEFITLMHLLSRKSFADITITASGATAGYHKFPLWVGTFPFDLEEYPLVVADMGMLQETRGGATIGNDTFTTGLQQLLGRGRFLSEAPKRRREWFMVQDATEAHIPRGRYHALHIVNAKADNANLYDGGLTVTGPDIAINNEDGRDLQRLFIEDYCYHEYTGEALNDPVALPDDACAGTFDITDIIQPIYWGGEDSMSWESGVHGPITIRKDDTNDPDMVVYCLRCVE
jgi:hypothetical protein